MKKTKPSILKNNKGDEPILKGTTCFAAHKEACLPCKKSTCRYWQDMEDKEHLNCVIIAAAKGPMTLQQVGNIFNVTRMRICQIEKAAKQFLKSSPSKIIREIKS